MTHISELVCTKLREIHSNSDFHVRKTYFNEYQILYGQNRLMSFDKILGIKGLDDYSLLEYYIDIHFLPYTSKPLDEIVKEIKKIISILNLLFCVLSNKKYIYLPIYFNSVSYLIYKNYKNSLSNDGEYIEFRLQENNNTPKIFFNLCLYFIPELKVNRITTNAECEFPSITISFNSYSNLYNIILSELKNQLEFKFKKPYFLIDNKDISTLL